MKSKMNIGKLVLSTLLIIFLVVPMSAQAQDEMTDPGITPDSILYPVDVFFDDIGLRLAFTEEAKINKQFLIVEERLSEAKAMSEANNTEGVQAAIEEHNRIMQQIQVRLNGSDNVTENLKTQLQLEERMRVHEENIVSISAESGQEEQGFMNGMLNQTRRIKEDIQQEKSMIMEQIDNPSQVECELKNNLGILSTPNGECNQNQ